MSFMLAIDANILLYAYVSAAPENSAATVFLQSLQQLVDEHGAMEQESLAKDEELYRLRQQLAEARERQVRQRTQSRVMIEFQPH